MTSLAEWGDTEPHRRLIWELHSRTDPDEPGNDDAAIPYEAFDKHVFGQENFKPEQLFIALADRQLVAVARLDCQPLTHSLYHSGMAVDREFRGRGVASALKRATIRYAAGIDATCLRTHTTHATRRCWRSTGGTATSRPPANCGWLGSCNTQG